MCDNESREKALWYTEQEILRNKPIDLNDKTNNWEKHGVLVIEAQIMKTEGHQQVEEKHKDFIRTLNSRRLKGAGNLYCMKNAPYMISKNQCVQKGIANGTIATLVDIILKNNVEVRKNSLAGQMVYAVYADEIRCLLFKHSLETWKSDHSFTSLPEGCFPLLPSTSNVKIPLGNSEKKIYG